MNMQFLKSRAALASAFALAILAVVSYGASADTVKPAETAYTGAFTPAHSDDVMLRDAQSIAEAANNVWYATHRFPANGAVRASACSTGRHSSTPCDPANVWSLALDRTPTCPATHRPYELVQAWEGTGFDVRCGNVTVWSQR